MPATFINAALVLLGSLLGMLFKDHIGARFHSILTHALGLCVLGIGISSAVGTENTLCVIVCMVLGTILGEALRIEDRLDSVGEVLRKKLVHGGGIPASPRASSPPPSSSAWAPWPSWAPWRRASKANTTS